MTTDEIEAALEQVASNQRRYFLSEHQERLLAAIKQRYGLYYIGRITDSIKSTGRKSVLFEVASVQPFKGPIDQIHGAPPHDKIGLDGTPDVWLHEVQAETRRMRTCLNLSGTFLDLFTRDVFREDETNLELEAAFDEAWREIEQEVLAHILYCTDPVVLVTAIYKKTATSDIQKLVNSNNDCPWQGPTNALLMSSDSLVSLLDSLGDTVKLRVENPCELVTGRPVKAGVLGDGINLYVDPLFPDKKVVAFRRPKGKIDRTIVWSPYLFTMYGPESRGCRSNIAYRGKTTVLSTDFVAHGEIQ
jgi:hypothetical protein